MTKRVSDHTKIWPRVLFAYFHRTFAHSSKVIELILLAAGVTLAVVARETWMHLAALAAPLSSVVAKMLLDRAFERTAAERLKLLAEFRKRYAQPSAVISDLQRKIQLLLEAQIRRYPGRSRSSNAAGAEQATARSTQGVPIDTDTTAPSTQAMTVIDAVVQSRRNIHQVASVILLLALCAYPLVSRFSGSPIETWLLVILAGAIALINIGAIALNYRVSRGLYGTNEYEAREIISFILNHSDDIDLSSGLGAQDIQLNDNTERLLAAAWHGEIA